MLRRGLWMTGWIAGWLPLWLGLFVSDRVGDVTSRTAARAQRAVDNNLRHVLGPDTPDAQIRNARRQVFRNVVRNYYDLMRTARLSDAEILARFHFEPEGVAQFRELTAAGRGVLIATPHWGAFDLLVQVIPMLGTPIHIIAARFPPFAFVEFINHLRTQRGARIIWTGEGLAMRQAIGALEAGEIVGVAPDRNLGAKGVMVPFFGAEAPMAPGLAQMSLRTGAPILPCFGRRAGPGHYAVVFTPPIYPPPPDERTSEERVAALTRAVAARFEAQIAQEPTQWVLLQSVWPAAPGGPPDTVA